VSLHPTDSTSPTARRARTDGDRGDREDQWPDSTRSPVSDRGSDRFVAAVAVDGEVLFDGPSVPAVLGVDRDVLTGDDFLDHVHRNDRESVSAAFRRRDGPDRHASDRPREWLDRFASIVSHDLWNPLSVI